MYAFSEEGNFLSQKSDYADTSISREQVFGKSAGRHVGDEARSSRNRVCNLSDH